MKDILERLRTAGESTRLRILVLLSCSELSTTELCWILGQTQPRVSRHLKVLADANLIQRNAEGVKAFYAIDDSDEARDLLHLVISQLDRSESQCRIDENRLLQTKAERAKKAQEYFDSVAADWEEIRSLHAADASIDQALQDAIQTPRIETLLDIGTGVGHVVRLLADRAEVVIGVDQNHQMLNVARSNLDDPELSHCAVRQGDAYALPIDTESVQIAVLHHVLHFLDDPAAAIAEAARTLRPDGQLIIVDFASHSLERLQTEFNHQRLGFGNSQILDWCEQAQLIDVQNQRFDPEQDSDQNLTVVLWSATKGQARPSPALPRRG